MHENFHIQPAAFAIALFAALASPGIAQAINIGEVVSQSRVGEPLRTQIELTGSGIENVENACLSLVAPDQNEEGARDYLTAARVAVKTEGQRQFAVISSHKPYNEPFIRLRLRVKCVGVGNVVKSFTILPEFAEALNVASPGGATETGGVAASGSSGADGASQVAGQGVSQESTQPQSRRSKRKSRAVRDADQTAEAAPKRRTTAARAARSKQGKEEAFRLRLSSESVDESRIGKISPEERTLLRARQKLLDADDQMASFLALQDQVKQLQAELGAVKLKLGSLGAGVPAATPAAPAVATTQAPQQQAEQPQPAAETKPESALQDQQAQTQKTAEQQAQEQQARKPQPAKQRPEKIQRGPIIFGLLILLGLLFGVRYYLRNRAQSTGTKPKEKKRSLFAPKSAAESAPVPAPATVPAPAPKPASAPAFKSPMQTKIAQPGAKPAAKPVAKPIVKAAVEKAPAPATQTDVPKQDEALAFSPAQKMSETVPMAPPAPRERTQEELAEADSIVEEAELYAIHGHPDRAVLILKELIQQHTNKTEAWMLLFSIFSSLKKVAEFEQAAMDFARSNKNSTAWPEIQALGRALDPGNVMYADFNAAGAEAASAPQPTMGKRALLGDILLAMGALSIKDMEKCLAEFDPKVDGRFGGFLIKRNLINEAQLEAALLQQQLNNEANAFQPDDAPPPAAAETPAPAEAPKPVETTMSMSLKIEEDEPKKVMLPALEFEPPAMDLPKMNKSPESDKDSGGH